MSKVGITGNTAIITSALKMEELKTLEKFHPDDLVVLDGNNEPVFRIGTGGADEGTVGKYGVIFNSANHDGYATVTVTFDPEGYDDPRDAVYEKFGAALAELNRMEGLLPMSLGEIEEEKEGVLASFYYI